MDDGRKFWELLKSQVRDHRFEFLRNRRVAVDLSYWVVLHEESSINSYRGVQNLHISLTFFRTIHLFATLGAFPVFVVDGILSPLKAKAKISRFFRAKAMSSDADMYLAYKKCIEECVELLQLLGMPVLRAKGDALALCAQLNREQHVLACLTDDIDALLYGAELVIKRFHRKGEEPFESYQLSDVDTGLGLKREHLIAITLLVRSDCDVNGLETAVRFVKIFSKDEILKRFHKIARGEPLLILGHINKPHPKFFCRNCSSTAVEITCSRKPVNETLQVAVCQKFALEKSFPMDDVIQMYLKDHHEKIGDLGWGSPKTELLVDYLASRQKWEPSYIRKSLFPMLTTIYLRSMEPSPTKKNLLLLNDKQYEFHNIQRVERRHGASYGGHEICVVNWKRSGWQLNEAANNIHEDDIHMLSMEFEETLDFHKEPPDVMRNGRCNVLQTYENMELVRNAFPEEVDRYWKAKELKEEMKPRKKKLIVGASEEECYKIQESANFQNLMQMVPLKSKFPSPSGAKYQKSFIIF